MFDLHFSRESFSSFQSGVQHEWLLANGIGGFASSTLLGANTRRYHGLLIAPLNPPSNRTLLLSGFDEEYIYRAAPQLLSCYEFADRTVHPKGFSHMLSCSIAPHRVEWEFGWDDLLLQKRIWMHPGENTVYVQYECLRATEPLQITLRPLCAFRDYHWHQNGERPYEVETAERQMVISTPDLPVQLTIAADCGSSTKHTVWYWNFFHRAEEERGLDSTEDLFIPGSFSAELEPGQKLTVASSTEGDRLSNTSSSLRAAEKKSKDFLKSFPKKAPDWIQALAAHSQHFIIERSVEGQKKPGASIIAGYPWFTDWTRDTMISLPGLTLATGNRSTAKRILETYGRFISEGMLPNRFMDAADELEYNSVDGSLLFFMALDEYLQQKNDAALRKSLFAPLEAIIEGYRNGTRHGICMDPEDSLLTAGEEGLQLTWMDAKVGDWVVTPRRGKPVEVNALWYNALEFMAETAKQLKKTAKEKEYRSLARATKKGFGAFWNDSGGYLYDVLGETPDDSFRPNQLFACALRFRAIDAAQQKSVLEECMKRLLTPWGLRTLDPRDPQYRPKYHGGPQERDGSYHQGTVWPWLIGIFTRAHLNVYKKPAATISHLEGLAAHLREAGVGHISEIFDGNPPHRPKGCFAQAWSNAEALYAWWLCEQAGKKKK